MHFKNTSFTLEPVHEDANGFPGCILMGRMSLKTGSVFEDATHHDPFSKFVQFPRIPIHTRWPCEKKYGNEDIICFGYILK